MSKAYGQKGRFSSLININQRKVDRDIFSDGASSFDSGSSGLAPPATERNTRPKRAVGKRTEKGNTVLADVSNVPHAPKGRRGARKTAKTVLPENIPNFDSFDDYSLVVQPVTPLKTHVSISTSDDPWGKFGTQELLKEIEYEKLHGPITSSPYRERQSAGVNASTNHSNSQSLSSHSRSCLTSGSTNSHSMETRRAKRLRQRLGESINTINTSTPEQVCRKISRLKSPELQVNISRIPPLHIEDELSASMHHMSLHDSLRELSPPQQDLDRIHSTVDGHCQTDLHGSHDVGCSDVSNIPSAPEYSNHSTSLFSNSHRTASQLDSILEEVELDDSDDGAGHLSVCDEAISILDTVNPSVSVATSTSSSVSTPYTSSSPTSAYHTAEEGLSSSQDSAESPLTSPPSAAPSAEFSDKQINSLIHEFQNFQSPTLSELSYKRRERSILRECLQKKFIPWSEYMSDELMNTLVKIGEGVYGEVFKYKDENDDTTIIKIVPMEGSCTVNDEPQKRFHEMTKEIQITKVLSRIGYNFINTKRIVCTQGTYPSILLDKWDEFTHKTPSENDRPDYFTADQYYVVFEFSDGGEALESYKFKNAAEGLSCLLQVGWSLAVAEDKCQFEHRDLHWGNVLVGREVDAVHTYSFHSCTGSTYTINSSNIKVNIIDFTLSRLRRGEEVVFCDLSEDETLFQGQGDYQFDIYRQMKDVTRNEWRKFYSVTNIFWMRYLADKLLKMKTFPSSRSCKPTTTQFKKELLGFYNRCAHYSSTIQMVLTDPLFQQYTTQSGMVSD